MPEALREQQKNDIFALDIGTRSIIGIYGRVENHRFHVLAIEKENHGQRTMMDGQIEDIAKVSEVAKIVVERVEKLCKIHLTRVCVAAAGRALRSESATFAMEMPSMQQITDENVGQLEAGAVSEAEQSLKELSGHHTEQYYMVGYTVTGYRVDGYRMSSIREHSGQLFEADVVATFLPREVVESLYAVVARLGMEVSSLTLEPIAALNAAIPSDIRLLNLVLVDIGAGTSDIAICRDGTVVGYTMATVAGDEITELLMRSLLIDFDTGEKLKMSLEQSGKIAYTDILGLPQEIEPEKLRSLIEPSVDTLAQEISKRIMELNGRVPSAVFLAGGGSKLSGLRERIAQELKIDINRVATAGNHFERNAFSEDYNLQDPEFATPLGIAVSAGLELINDSYFVTLNGAPAKLFRSGVLVLRDILLMNGYHYGDMMGRTGANMTVSLNGERRFFRGELATPPDIRINGREATLSDVVNAGDRITFSPAVSGADAHATVQDLLGEDFYGRVTVNGALAELDEVIHNGDEIWADYFERPESGEARTSEDGQSESGGKGTAGSDGQSVGPSVTVTFNGEEMYLSGKSDGEPYYLMDMLQYSKLDFDHLEKPVEMKVNGVPGAFSQRLNNGDQVEIT